MDWLAVPSRLAELYPKYIGMADDALKASWDGVFVDDLGYVPLSKQAIEQARGAFKPVADAFDLPQQFVGGPTPLTATLLGGALGAGLGYAGGRLGEKMFPEYLARGRARRNLAIMGGLAGAAPFALGLGLPAMQLEGAKGLMHNYKSALDKLCHKLNIEIDSQDLLFKAAADMGGSFAPTIPVDQFNQVVLQDPNLPAPMRAATTGLLTATSLAQNSNYVSPMDVARMAIGLGSGVASGILVGKTIGMLAGMNPSAQLAMQRTGMLAGALLSVVPRLF